MKKLLIALTAIGLVLAPPVVVLVATSGSTNSNEDGNQESKTPWLDLLAKEIKYSDSIQKGNKTQEAHDTLKQAIESAKKVTSESDAKSAFEVLRAAEDVFFNSEEIEDVVTIWLNALNYEIQYASEIQQGLKNEASYQTLKNAIEVAKEITTEDEAKAAFEALRSEIDAFYNSPDETHTWFEALKNEIGFAKEIEQGNKPEEVFAELKKAIEEAVVIAEAEITPSEDDAKTAFETLRGAIDTFYSYSEDPKQWFDALNYEVNQGNSIQQGSKSSEEYAKLQEALKIAGDVISSDPSEDEAKTAFEELRGVINTFYNSPDVFHPWFDALKYEVASADNIEKGTKTEEAFALLKSAIQEAQSIANAENTPSEDNAKTAFENLREAIVEFYKSPEEGANEGTKTPWLDALKYEIENASGIENTIKTEEAYDKLKEAIAEAKNKLSQNPDETEAKAAFEALRAAETEYYNSVDKGANEWTKRPWYEALKYEIDRSSVMVQGKKYPEAFTKLQAGRQKAIAVFESDPSEYASKVAYQDLRNAMVIFYQSPDMGTDTPWLNGLKYEIERVKTIQKGRHTQEDFDKLQQAIRDAEAVLNSNPDEYNSKYAYQILRTATVLFHQSPMTKAEVVYSFKINSY
ncbi:hypothetical protein [[Acholeplasma] multilocale]|uniref:hypothetical protein n=1 Tax=[Acholeplasma] multilocale TaxID=264638 RepID=UPI00047BD43E|nr:hypothetical protein [[Acholeplasma] multilocale]